MATEGPFCVKRLTWSSPIKIFYKKNLAGLLHIVYKFVQIAIAKALKVPHVVPSIAAMVLSQTVQKLFIDSFRQSSHSDALSRDRQTPITVATATEDAAATTTTATAVPIAVGVSESNPLPAAAATTTAPSTRPKSNGKQRLKAVIVSRNVPKCAWALPTYHHTTHT